MNWIGRTRFSIAIAGVAVAVAVALSIYNESTPKTPGEEFREALRQIEKACESRKPEPNEQCGEVTKLKPADPTATPEGRFAHSIKLPDALPEDSGYRESMSPREYFEHLCSSQAGEFIYKTADGVRSVFVMRPRVPVTDTELKHLFALEDPYGDVSGEYRDLRNFVQPDLGKYERIETPYSDASRPNEKVREFYRDDAGKSSRKHQTARGGQMVFVPYVVSERIKAEVASRYAITWRGITRENDREMGIAGGELIILDLKSGVVLGVRRGFIRTGSAQDVRTGVWWLNGETCPQLSSRPNRFFVYDVLRPARLPELVPR